MTIAASRPGDIVFFWGRGFLSGAIRFFTRGPTHSGIILDPQFVTDDGAGLGGPYIAESTIENGIDGVQVNSLPLRIKGYDVGGSICVAHLDDRIRGILDFDAMWDLFYRKVNRDRYNKLELLQYVISKTPILQDIPEFPSPNAEVCSELVSELFSAGGLPGLDSFRIPPRGLWRLKVYSGADWLLGDQKDLDKFNLI